MDISAPRILTTLAWLVIAFCMQAQPQAEINTTLITARELISRGNFPKAETLLRATLEYYPTSPDAHFLLGLVLFHENNPRDSLAEYTQGAQLRTPTADELIAVASDYILIKDYSDADKWLTTATQIAPRLAKGWYLLGRTQYNENQIANAEGSFLRCLRIDAHDVRAEYNLGLVYENSNRPEEAVKAYETAIKWEENISTKDPQPFLDLGMLRRRQGHIEEALPYLLAAEKAGPRNPLSHAEVGLAYEQVNRFDEAIAELKQALVLSPNVEALHFYLGRIYRRAGQADEADKEFAAVAKLSRAQSSNGIPNEDVNP